MLNGIKRGIKRLVKSVNDAACAATKAASDIYKTKCEVEKIKLDMLKSVGSSIKNSCSRMISACNNMNKTKVGVFGLFVAAGLIAADKIK